VRNRARQVVTLLIDAESPLAKGRMPRGAIEGEEGIRASFDPVSYGALRASLGEFIPLQEVQAMFDEAIRKKLEEGSAQGGSAGADGEGPA
jgi:hypothetical protein